MKRSNQSIKIFVFLLIFLMFNHAVKSQKAICQSHTMWDTPSKDALESMPLSGRSGAGAYFRVPNGYICLFLAHNGAIYEKGRLLRLKCLSITHKKTKLGETGFYLNWI